MAKMSPAEIHEFLDASRIAHLTALQADGSPQTTPVWYQFEDGVFYVFSSAPFAKVGNIRNDPRISICVSCEDEPYRYVTADGVAHLTQQGALERASAIASRYRGDGGAAYAREVDETYGGLWLISLTPRRLLTWRSGD